MPSIPPHDRARAIDRVKVCLALFRYYMIRLWVLAANSALWVVILMLFTGRVHSALVMYAWILVGFVGVYSMHFFYRDRGKYLARRPELRGPLLASDTPIVSEWEARCAKYGFVSGGVYFFISPANPEFEEMDNLATFAARWPFFRETTLLISERMARTFPLSDLGAMLEHELGHSRLRTMCFYPFFELISLPTKMLMWTIVIARFSLMTTRVRVFAPLLVFVERLVFLFSDFCTQQEEEIAADALAASAIDATGSLICFFEQYDTKQKQLIRSQHALSEFEYMKRTAVNAHLSTHPSLVRRITCLRRLHRRS